VAEDTAGPSRQVQGERPWWPTLFQRGVQATCLHSEISVGQELTRRARGENTHVTRSGQPQEGMPWEGRERPGWSRRIMGSQGQLQGAPSGDPEGQLQESHFAL
jgi:hypothetical protein